MKLFAVRTDHNKYMALDLEVNDFIENFPEEITYQQAHLFSYENIALSEFWSLGQTGFAELEGSENVKPDICKWIDATLLLSPKAYRLLGDSMAPYGEFLSVILDGETYQIFNCLTTAKVIEAESSETKLVFDEKSVGDKLLFKSPFQSCIDIYCSERFKTLVEDCEFAGVNFDTRLASPYSA